MNKDIAALLVDDVWYEVKNFASGTALAEDFKHHLADQTPAAYTLGAPLGTAADDAPPKPTHVILDRSGSLIPLGVVTHGDDDAEPA